MIADTLMPRKYTRVTVCAAMREVARESIAIQS
jgi:hypothetical protein